MVERLEKRIRGWVPPRSWLFAMGEANIAGLLIGGLAVAATCIVLPLGWAIVVGIPVGFVVQTSAVRDRAGWAERNKDKGRWEEFDEDDEAQST